MAAPAEVSLSVCLSVCFITQPIRGLAVALSVLTFHLSMPEPSTRITNHSNTN